MYDAIADEYCYAGTAVLKNKLDLRDPDELSAFEAEVSDARADEALPFGTLDYPHFRVIHHHLFQDVYDRAGSARAVRISKDSNMFCYPENIESEANKLFTKLRQDKILERPAVKRICTEVGSFPRGIECHTCISRR
jgi:cell filamentation protein